MLGQIRKAKRPIAFGILLAGALMLVSCATEQQKQVGLVNDPDEKKGDSMIPWNKQEKWETSGALGGITDRR